MRHATRWPFPAEFVCYSCGRRRPGRDAVAQVLGDPDGILCGDCQRFMIEHRDLFLAGIAAEIGLPWPLDAKRRDNGA